MVAMEPPSRNDADAIRDEKLKVLRSLKPFTEETVVRDVVRGQYRAGSIENKRAIGYLDEVKVPADSQTETFVAIRTEVQNWRWAGVPFYLRTGKRLAARDAQIVVNFRPTPHSIFPGHNQPNKLVIKLQPEDGLELHLLAAKGTGQHEMLTPVSLGWGTPPAGGRFGGGRGAPPRRARWSRGMGLLGRKSNDPSDGGRPHTRFTAKAPRAQRTPSRACNSFALFASFAPRR
jgi:hypothetical protein